MDLLDLSRRRVVVDGSVALMGVALVDHHNTPRCKSSPPTEKMNDLFWPPEVGILFPLLLPVKGVMEGNTSWEVDQWPVNWCFTEQSIAVDGFVVIGEGLTWCLLID